MSCGHSSSMSNSSRNRLKLGEQTVIRVRINFVQHIKPINKTLMTQQQETLDQDKVWPPTTPGAGEAESDIQQLTHTMENNIQGLREQMQNSNEVTQRCPQNLIYVLSTSKKKFSERHWKQYHELGFRRYILRYC